MSSSSGTYDTKNFFLCEPWQGQRGHAFAHRFLPDFESGCMSKNDDYATWEQHLHGEVPGGVLETTPAQLANNPSHVNIERPHAGNANEQRKSEAAFYNRESIVLAAFRRHIPVEPIRIRIDQVRQAYKDSDFAAGAPVTNVVVIPAVVANAGAGVAGVHAYPVYAPGHPSANQPLSAHDLAAYQACGNSLTRHIIRIIRLEAVPDPSSGLTQLDANNRWSNLKLEMVGITSTSPRDLAAVSYTHLRAHETDS